MIFLFYPSTISGNTEAKFSHVVNERNYSDWKNKRKKQKIECQTQGAQYADSDLKKATVPKATFECQMKTTQKDNGKL